MSRLVALFQIAWGVFIFWLSFPLWSLVVCDRFGQLCNFVPVVR